MTLNLIFANESIPTKCSGIFLAGPMPCSIEVKSWRPDAIRILEQSSSLLDCIFIPESQTWIPNCGDYESQVKWEHDALEQASTIMFWVPRNLENMPAFTTNLVGG